VLQYNDFVAGFSPIYSPKIMTFDHVRTWKQEFEASGWWHSFELPDGTTIQGRCDLIGLKERLANFPVPADLTGKRVLDIGTWDGWYAFELAKRGAEVVAIDCWDNPRFYEMRRIMNLESRVDYRLMDVYDIAPENLGQFDVVMFLGVLYHLKHPLLALERVCSVTRDLACVDSFVLREPHHVVLPFDGRLVMEFFETDEFGGQTDNWVAPSAPCLAAMCRTAGFARTALVGSLQYSASYACFRHWVPRQQDWGATPQLVDVAHHLDWGINFSTSRDDYIVAWFDVDSSDLGLDDVFPEVSGFGVRPIHVGRGEFHWMATFKLPPGLKAGWHEVRLQVRGSRLSEAVRIAVDLPRITEGIRITAVLDGNTWTADEIDLSRGTVLSVWLAGLPESADRSKLCAKVGRKVVEISYVEPHGIGETRQVNLVIPPDRKGECPVEISLGAAKATGHVRIVPL
jgi:tRNA (mo5U34)-methyltransferase